MAELDDGQLANIGRIAVMVSQGDVGHTDITIIPSQPTDMGTNQQAASSDETPVVEAPAGEVDTPVVDAAPFVETPVPQGDTPGGDTLACETLQCSDLDCGICQEALVSDTPATDTPEQLESLLCGHTFHRYCIHKYAESMNTRLAYLACPLCRMRSVDIDASQGVGTVFDIDNDDHDPEAAGSQDPLYPGLQGKGTGKFGTFTVISPVQWSDILSSDASAPDDPPTSADVPASDGTPANVSPPSDMPAGGTPSDGKSKGKGKGKVRAPTADTPAGGTPSVGKGKGKNFLRRARPLTPTDDTPSDVAPSDVKGKGKAVTPADGTPADGKGIGKAGKAGRGGKGCKGNAGKAGKVGNDAAEPAAEPVTAPVAAPDDTGISATL